MFPLYGVREVLRRQPTRRVAWLFNRVYRCRRTCRHAAFDRTVVTAVLADFHAKIATAEAGHFRQLSRTQTDPQADLDIDENKLDGADNRSADPEIDCSCQFVEQAPCLC